MNFVCSARSVFNGYYSLNTLKRFTSHSWIVFTRRWRSHSWSPFIRRMASRRIKIDRQRWSAFALKLRTVFQFRERQESLLNRFGPFINWSVNIWRAWRSLIRRKRKRWSSTLIVLNFSCFTVTSGESLIVFIGVSIGNFPTSKSRPQSASHFRTESFGWKLPCYAKVSSSECLHR